MNAFGILSLMKYENFTNCVYVGVGRKKEMLLRHWWWVVWHKVVPRNKIVGYSCSELRRLEAR